MPDPLETAAALAASTADLPREWFEALLDTIPTPLLVVEPGTGRTLAVNAAADALAGGSFPRDDGAAVRSAVTDAEGRPIDPGQLPRMRAARGERLRNLQVDWHLPDGTRTLLVSSETLPPLHGQPPLTLITFEDVTQIKRAEAGARRAERVADETVALLDTLFFSAPVGLAFFDRDLRYVRVNEALAAINGHAVDDHLGRTLAEIVPGVGGQVGSVLAQVLETGEPIVDVDIVGRTAAAPGEDRHWVGSFYPVSHRSGIVLGLGAVIVDVTERVRLLASERRARERAAFLARAGEVLGASLDDEETLRQLAYLAVPAKADWCAIDMLDDGGRVRRLAMRHIDPAKERLGLELFDRWPPRAEGPGLPETLLTGHPLLLPEISDEVLEAAAQDDEHLRVLRELGLRSAMVVALRSRGRVVGAMSFVSAESGRRYDDDSLSLALEVARRASIAIENASLHQQIGYIARTLQASLLPPRLPEIPGFDVAARYRAAGEGFEVGGDFYDVFERAEGSWTVVLGDVVGKGPPAAALTALARYTARAAAYEHPEPARVLGLLNDAVRREAEGERFMTAVAGTLTPGDPAVLTLASGGHPPAIVVRGGRAEPLSETGRLLGLPEEPRLPEVRLELAPGDAVVLYTDGVTDAAAPARQLTAADVARIVASCAAAPAEAIAATLERAAVAGTDGRPRDDIAIVVLRRLPG